MPDANQIRINELARELEVKARAILDYLPEAGVTEKKTHSSSIDVAAAEKVKKHFQQLAQAEADAEAAANPPAEAEVSPSEEPVADEPAPEIALEDETADDVVAREAREAAAAKSAESSETETESNDNGVGEAHSATSASPETVVPAEPQPEKE